MINLPALYSRLQKLGHPTEEQMPWAYQVANPQGRPLHNDWGIMSNNPILTALQPYQKITRRECAYRVQLPFKCLSGPTIKKWLLWDLNYPTVPGTPIEIRPIWNGEETLHLPHALVDVADLGATSWAVLIDGGWVECFYQYSTTFFGRRFLYYHGLKQDLTVSPPNGQDPMRSDLMAWFPEASMSLIKVK